MFQHIVGNGNKRIFLSEHCSVLTDKCQTVHIGVYHDAEIKSAGLHPVHYSAEVLLQRLRIMREVAVRIAVQYLIFNAQCLEKLRQDYASHAVVCIGTNPETGFSDSLYVNQLQCKHRVDMLLVICIILYIMSESVNTGIFEILLFRNSKHLVALFLVEKLSATVQQLQGIPLPRVMTRGNDYAAVGNRHAHRKLRSGRRGKTDVDHIIAHTHKRSAHHAVYHPARYAGIAPYDNPARCVIARAAADECGICRYKLHNVQRIERVTRASADCAADA